MVHRYLNNQYIPTAKHDRHSAKMPINTTVLFKNLQLNKVTTLDFINVNKCPIRKSVFFCFFLMLTIFSQTFSQVDNFSNEEADYFRSQKIYPLVSHEQDGDYPRGTYLIPHDITVPSGKVLTLYPGSTFLFKKDTRLVIKGKLISKGKMLNPVLFCKLDNKDYYTPVDSMVDTKWDGIFIEDSGKIELQFTHISESKYGISISESADEVTLDSIQFYDNRYQNLKIGINEIPVKERTPFFHQINSQTKQLVVAPTNNTRSTNIESVELIPKQKQMISRGVRTIRIITTTGMILGAATGAGGYFLYEKNFRKYGAVSESDKKEVANISKYRTRSILGEGMRNGGAGVTVVCLIGFTISLFY